MKIKINESYFDKDIGYSIYKNDIWTRDIDYIINANIYEYDMKNAGFNLIKYYELLDKKTIDNLESLPKNIRNIQIGLLMKENKDFNNKLTQSFRKMRKTFLFSNQVKEHQILSIKKDAIYLVNKACENTKFKNVEFVLKNRYTSFHKFSNIEFYYRNKGQVLDVKGIKDDKLEPHKDYMCKFLKDIFNLLETSSNERIVSKLKHFSKFYKSRKLEYQYYRELNSDSYYSLIVDGSRTIKSETYITGFDIDISYNYMTYILPLIQRFFDIKV
mgnify:CR=1 FL=1